MSDSIALLSQSVADELHAVHQYMYFHFHLADQGYELLARLFKKTAIVEMGHVEALAERILFLKDAVEMQASSKVEKITEPAAVLTKAIEMERASARDYNIAAQKCGAAADAASKLIFESLVRDEEGHQDQFERQLDNVKRIMLCTVCLFVLCGAS